MQQAGLCGKGQHEKNALTFRILPHQSEFLKHRSHHSTRLWRRWPDRQALGMKQGGKCTQLTSPWCGGGGSKGTGPQEQMCWAPSGRGIGELRPGLS